GFAEEEVEAILHHLTGTEAAPEAVWTLSAGIAGQSDEADHALRSHGLSREQLGEDGYLITRNAEGLLIAGYTGRSVLYGIYHLIRSATGFEWTRPWAGSAPAEPIRDATLT